MQAILALCNANNDMEGKADTLRLRYRIVEEYNKTLSIRKTAKKLGCSKDTVSKWVKRAASGELLVDRPRCGRPDKGLKREEAMELLRQSILDGLGPSQMAKLLHERLNIQVNAETVRRHLKMNLGRPLRTRRKPKLSAAHRVARLAFSRKWRRRSWDRVVVTDSKYFWLCPRGVGPKRWVLYGQAPLVEQAERNCYKVHVYAGVSRWGRTPMFVTVGTTGFKAESKGVNAAVYLKLLQEELIPACKELIATSPVGHQPAGSSMIFQQDNAKAHTSKVVQTWLRQQDFEVMDWPSKSPDLSWIENMWAYVAKRLSIRPGLTPENFEQAVKEEWENIPLHVHNNMYSSIKKRLEACIDNNGGSTKY